MPQYSLESWIYDLRFAKRVTLFVVLLVSHIDQHLYLEAGECEEQSTK